MRLQLGTKQDATVQQTASSITKTEQDLDENKAMGRFFVYATAASIAITPFFPPAGFVGAALSSIGVGAAISNVDDGSCVFLSALSGPSEQSYQRRRC